MCAGGRCPSLLCVRVKASPSCVLLGLRLVSEPPLNKAKEMLGEAKAVCGTVLSSSLSNTRSLLPKSLVRIRTNLRWCEVCFERIDPTVSRVEGNRGNR